MKKVISFGLITLLSVSFLGACSGKTEKKETKQSSTVESSISESSSSKQNSTDSSESSQIESKNQNGKKVTYKVESTYKKGTIGYASDEIQAKREAIAEQSPDELSDYDFLTSTGFYAKPVFYLNEPDSSDEEKKAEKVELQANIDQAKILNEQLKQVKKTINNSKEYADLQNNINKALANESYLK